MELTPIPRDVFVARVWAPAYSAGDHVTILGPTGWGKTQLAHDLIDAVAKPSMPALILVMKPRDATVSAFQRRMRFRRVRRWPMAPNPLRAPARGYVVWPRHTFDPDRDDAALYWAFRAVMQDSYKRGNRIIFVDEAAGTATELDQPGEIGMDRLLKTLWMRGRSMGVGVWAASQRPVDVPLHAYSQAQHLFLGNDPDYRGRARYAEIGGIDPRVVHEQTSRLQPWHWLYISRRGPRIAVVGP